MSTLAYVILDITQNTKIWKFKVNHVVLQHVFTAVSVFIEDLGVGYWAITTLKQSCTTHHKMAFSFSVKHSELDTYPRVNFMMGRKHAGVRNEKYKAL